MSLTSVVLSSGRSIDLTELHLSSTYGNMLAGYPCERVNDMKIEGLLRRTERDLPGRRVHLVPPVRTYPEGSDGSPGPWGPVEVLPRVTCKGTFRSAAIDPGHDAVLYRSALTVIWFQDTPQAPAAETAAPGLRDVRWEELALDHEL
ncbi:hypothetical protein ACFYPN_02115 [Streptomyces sp. NPDC005576]|uniref:hypothetical protein n=1 Tax=unclassified Streptomyces TaxID=2593676 RepID=UPI0033CAAF00